MTARQEPCLNERSGGERMKDAMIASVNSPPLKAAQLPVEDLDAPGLSGSADYINSESTKRFFVAVSKGQKRHRISWL